MQPDIVIVMPCGYDAEIAHREAEMHRDELAAHRRRRGRRRRRRRPTSPGPGRGSSTASSCSRTSSIPSCSPSAPGARRSPSSSERRGASGRGWRASSGALQRQAVGREPVPPATAIAATTLITATSDAAGDRRAPAAGAARRAGRSNQPQIAPPTTPPRWPPIEIPATLSEKTMLISSVEPEPALPDRDAAVVGDHDQRAEDPEAGAARRRPSPTSGWNSSAPNEPASSDDEVDGDEVQRADRRLRASAP